MRDERLIVLLDAYLDGSLTAEEKLELERMLLESDAARQQFWERASLHGWTYAAAKLNYGTKPAAAAAKERRNLSGVSFDVFVSWLRRASQWGWRAALAGAACGAALMLWIGIRALEPAAAEEDAMVDAAAEPMVNTNLIATLTRGTGVVWDGETNGVEIGSAVGPQWLHLKSGAVQIDFNSGAQMIVEGPASLELVSANEARLDFGKVSAHVPEPAHGFKVYTADATVTDLGTAFGLERQGAKPVKVEVFEGKVEVATESANAPEIVKAGNGVQVKAQQLEPLAPVDWEAFLSAQELARRETAELRLRYEGWRLAQHWLENDPSMLVHFDFEDGRDSDRTLVNHAIDAKGPTQAMIYGCDWGEGRWPGKSALEFNRINDRVRLSVPGAYESLTYLTWLRVDSLPNQWNALALADTAGAGETHWQIHRNGSVEFTLRNGSGKNSWKHLVSKPVITRDHFGKWIQLAAVYDGTAQRMILYMNGRRIASKAAKVASLTPGALELGNWPPGSATTVNRIRDFHGRMDEFTLFDRALSADEIHRRYEVGKPREMTTIAESTPSAK